MVKHSDKHASVSKTSVKSSSVRRRSYDIAEKRSLVAEAKEKGIRETAQNHNMSYAALHLWMLKDFSDLPGTKKRLRGAGRPLKYDASIDGTLRDWVIQRMMVTERVSQAEIKQKALELILPHNPDFRASRGWVTRFLRRHSINLKENTITVLYDNDGHIQDGGHYHYQQQSSSNTFPVVSYFTIKSEDNNAVLYQPTMEEVIEDGLVPFEEDFEIISNCDFMDLESTANINDITSTTHEPASQSLTMHASSETVEKRIPTTTTSNTEFTPVINSCNTSPLDVNNHQSKSGKRKSYDQSVEIILKDWILQRTTMEKRRVSHKELRKKAQELILPYNPKFLASSFWIRNFLHRHGISLNAVMHGMQCTKSRSKNDKNSSKHPFTAESELCQAGGPSVLEQENTCPSLELQIRHNHDFAPTQTCMHHLQKIGRPRELLKQQINWKRMVLSIPKQHINQHTIRTSKTLHSKGQKGTKKMPRKQSRKKIRNAASIIDGILKENGLRVARDVSATEMPNVDGPSTSYSDVGVKRLPVGASCDSKKGKKPVGATSNKRLSSSREKEQASINHRTWEISEKRQLVAEAIQKGIRATARHHNMSFSTLRGWTKQDFSNVPGNRKRLPGGGRPLKYDQSIDLALREWVLQKTGVDGHTTRDELKRKAMEMILPHNPDFRASSGWLIRFLTRHKLTLDCAARNNRKKNSSQVEFQAPVSIKVKQEGPDSSQHVPDFLAPEGTRQTLPSKKSKSSKKTTTLQGKRQRTTTATAPTAKRKKS